MKSKKSIYLLLPLVLLVWGVIGYKILNNKKKRSSNIIKSSSAYTVAEEIEKDTFTLLNHYFDPFLKRPYRRATKVNTSVTSTKAPKRTQSKPRQTSTKSRVWPIIEYKGLIHNDALNRTSVSLLINKQYVIFTPLLAKEELVVTEVNEEYVVIQFNEEEKKFYKK